MLTGRLRDDEVSLLLISLIRCNHLKRGAKVAGCYCCINVLSKNKEGLVAGAGVKKKSSLVEEWSVMVREEQRELGEKFSWTNKSL